MTLTLTISADALDAIIAANPMRATEIGLTDEQWIEKRVTEWLQDQVRAGQTEIRRRAMESATPAIDDTLADSIEATRR